MSQSVFPMSDAYLLTYFTGFLTCLDIRNLRLSSKIHMISINVNHLFRERLIANVSVDIPDFREKLDLFDKHKIILSCYKTHDRSNLEHHVLYLFNKIHPKSHLGSKIINEIITGIDKKSLSFTDYEYIKYCYNNLTLIDKTLMFNLLPEYPGCVKYYLGKVYFAKTTEN